MKDGELVSLHVDFKRLIFFFFLSLLFSFVSSLKMALDKVTHGTVSILFPRDNHFTTKKQMDLINADLTKNRFFSKTNLANVFNIRNVGACFIINATAYSTTFASVSFSSSIAVDHPAAFGNDVNEIESSSPVADGFDSPNASIRSDRP